MPGSVRLFNQAPSQQYRIFRAIASYAIERKQVAEQLRSANQALQAKVEAETAQLVKQNKPINKYQIYRTENTHSIPGTGLGLAIVKFPYKVKWVQVRF